jgi:hypothetical protein
MLLWMRLRGRVRLLLKRTGALQSALLTVVAALLVIGLIGSFIAALFVGRSQNTSTFIARAETWTPVIILAGWVSTLLLGGKAGALAFTPADTDQLFPGPFSRRELVLYRICVQSFGALVSGAFAGLWLIMHAGTFLGGWLAFVLLMLFLQFSNIALSIAREAGGNRLRMAVIVPVVMLLGYVLLASGAAGGDLSRLVATITSIRESRIASALLMPLEPFGRAYAATDTPTALLNVAGCFGLALLMVLFILRLDAVSLEASLAATQKVQAQLERMRRGKSIFRPTATVEIPMPRLLGRASPIAWRQFTGVVRSGAWTVVPAGALVGVIVGSLDEQYARAVVPMATMMFVFALPNLLRFDFRAELDQLSTLKTLPLAPITVAAGQLAAPAIAATLMIWALIAGVLVRNIELGYALLPGLAIAPAVVTILMACENILFLLYPYRTAASGVMDVRHMLRGMLAQIAKVTAVGLAIGPGVLLIFGSVHLGLGLFPGVAAACVVLALECVGLTFVLAWAFDRFDPARDMPA